MNIVSKFGGTSMASAESIAQVVWILMQDERRRIVVVSAPGVHKGSSKMTDLLLCNNRKEVRKRLQVITAGLFTTPCVYRHLTEKLNATVPGDALVAFGEYASAYMLASFLNCTFVDATNVIHFDGECVTVRIDALKSLKRIIVPGFYGLDVETKQIRLFPRGGSDITGAYIASALKSTVYENWTDVAGVYTHDPRMHRSAMHYHMMSYDELERVAKNGARVFHVDAIRPVREQGIPTIIKNTFAPHEFGTLIF